ncbi:cuticle protein AM1159-like [Penaeus japonicus]|uniref:cuticle protein AM1159-like n=1 Tax=Penaeus japonicus TaxID=27405 RepID=UPI001C70B045|nr:cuticle protein AM1159-like [Penaeus japonicus]
MKTIIFAAVLVLAAAAPQEPRPIEILLDERVQPEGGAYSFKYETENGIAQTEEGAPGLEGQTNVQGSFSYLLDDGSVVELRYKADENGFQAESPLLPVAPEFPHEIPQFVLDQIAFAEEQRRLEALNPQPQLQ